MPERLVITVGQGTGDLVGSDNRALQAAVDYVGGLGGGLVIIGPGTYLMRDSLHLRSGVTVRGQGVETVLRKADAVESRLIVDGDYDEEQITVADASGFAPGSGVTITSDQVEGFHNTVRTIIAVDGNTCYLNGPILFNCGVADHAIAQTVFPVISGYHVVRARAENLTIEGNRASNPRMNGCRGAGIYLYRGQECVISDCLIRDYNGDGISFQMSRDVCVERCETFGNTALGLHPGSGTLRPVIADCHSHDNGEIGLFLCWRVRQGRFERNTLTRNGHTGISIGHKDTDNLFVENVASENGRYGLHFRDETEGNAGHRNRFVGCRFVDNGALGQEGVGVQIEGATHDLTFEDCVISDRRPEGQKTQAVGLSVGPQADRISLRRVDLNGNARSDIESRAGAGAIVHVE